MSTEKIRPKGRSEWQTFSDNQIVNPGLPIRKKKAPSKSLVRWSLVQYSGSFWLVFISPDLDQSEDNEKYVRKKAQWENRGWPGYYTVVSIWPWMT